jgi:phage-related protein
MDDINKIKYNSFGEALKGIGRQIQTEVLLPIAKDVLPSLNDMANQLKAAFSSEEMQSSIKSLSDGIGNFIKGVASAAQDTLPKLLDALAWILDNASIIASGIVGIGVALKVFEAASLVMGLVEAFNKARKATEGLTVAQWLYNTAMAANPIGIVISIIAGLIAAVIVLWNTNEGFKNAIIGAWNAIKDAGMAVWGWLVNLFTETIPSAFNAVISWITDNWQGLLLLIVNPFAGAFKLLYDNCDGFRNFINTFIEAVKQFFINGWNAIADFFTQTIPALITNILSWFNQLSNGMAQAASNAINGVINWFSQLPDGIGTWLSNAISRISEFASNLGSRAREAGSNMVSNIVDAIVNLPSRMADIGSNIVEGLWNGIIGMGGWLGSKVSGFFSGIVDNAKEALGIHSPSRVFRDQVGKYMAQGVGVGFEDESKDVQKGMQDNLSSLTAKMQTTVDYETSRTSTAVAAKNTYKESNSDDNPGTNGIPEGSIFILKNDIDGKALGETVYKVVDGKLAIASRRKRG